MRRITFCIFIFVLLFSVGVSKDHLNTKENELILAKYEANNKEVLKYYSIRFGCPEDRATTIALMLDDHSSERSLKWADQYPVENWIFDYEYFVALYIRSLQKIPVPRLSEELFNNKIRYVGIERNLAAFMMQLENVATTQYPLPRTSERYHDLSMKGLKCELSEEEISMLKKQIFDDLSKGKIINNDLFLPIRAYINQTGDLEFIIKLWDNPEMRFICVFFASQSNDPNIVKVVLDLSEPYIQNYLCSEEGRNIVSAMHMLIFQQKQVEGIQQRLSMIMENSLFIEVIEQLQYSAQVTSEDGWLDWQDRANHSLLEHYHSNLMITTKKVEDAMRVIELRSGVR